MWEDVCALRFQNLMKVRVLEHLWALRFLCLFFRFFGAYSLYFFHFSKHILSLSSSVAHMHILCYDWSESSASCYSPHQMNENQRTTMMTKKTERLPLIPLEPAEFVFLLISSTKDRR